MKTSPVDDESPLYEFNDFRVDPVRRQLRRSDEFVPMPPKVFDTLLALVRDHGRVLEKDELIETVWPDTTVEENNLTQNISAIRKILGDDRREKSYVVTIPGRGYQFIAKVREVPVDHAANGNHPQPILVPPATTQKHRPGKRYALALIIAIGCLATMPFFWSINQAQPTNVPAGTAIAVLPFESLNTEGPDQYIGTGMSDALTTKLSSIREIAVRPSSSSLRNASISKDPVTAGRQLGVDFVIDGHVQRVDDRLRVTVEMIRTSDGAVPWAMPFDENFKNVFALQDTISEQVASALRVKLTGEERRQIGVRYTQNIDAYAAYMKATYLMRESANEKIKKSIDYYRQALDLDPAYALAYAGLADTYIRLHSRGIPVEKGSAVQLARESIDKALQIDDGVAYAHSIRGFIAFRYDWDFETAEKEYRRARELDPNYVHSWFGFYLLTANRTAEAEDEFRRFQVARPLASNDIYLYHYFRREYDLAQKELQTSLDINATDAPDHANLGTIYEQKGLFKEAVDEFRKSRALAGRNEIGGGLVAHAFAISGKKNDARKILAEMMKEPTSENFSADYMVAIVNTALGDKGQAIDHLERAFDTHSLGPAWLCFDPRLDTLRAEPRFQALLRRTGLPQQKG